LFPPRFLSLPCAKLYILLHHKILSASRDFKHISASTLKLKLIKRCSLPIIPITPPNQVLKEKGCVAEYFRTSHIWLNPNTLHPASSAIIALLSRISLIVSVSR